MRESTAFAINPDGSPGAKLTIREPKQGRMIAVSPDTGITLAIAQFVGTRYDHEWAVASPFDPESLMCVTNKQPALRELRRMAGRFRSKSRNN